MLLKIKIYFIVIPLVILGCAESNQEKIQNIKLNEKLANELVSLSVKCVDQKYPYKIGYRFVDESSVKPHYELTPSFYGCWDWHSAVHGHWAMVKILKDFPEISDRDIILTKLDKNLSKDNLDKEYEFFKHEFAKGFERTYGWAWLMKLYSELLSWDNERAQIWANNMKPLVDLLSERTVLFLDKLSTPLRPGTHANTAFSFSLMIEYSKIANDKVLFNKIKDYSIDRNITLNCNLEKVSIGIKTLIPLGLIVNEIISNALKHAFSGRNDGVVFVSLQKISEHKFELLIGDDGVGYTQLAPTEKGDSLGLELVKVFTEQLDGTIEKLNTVGTNYKIIFRAQD